MGVRVFESYLVRWRKKGRTRESDWFSAICTSKPQAERFENYLKRSGEYEVEMKKLD